jgi:hypothetical protein
MEKMNRKNKKTELREFFKKKSELRESPGRNNPKHFDFKKLKIKKKWKFGKV